MSDDIVQRLRDACPATQDFTHTAQGALMDEAADRIEALTAERDRLREHVARMEAAIRDRIHWLDEDNGHCDCGACLALVAALKGETP